MTIKKDIAVLKNLVEIWEKATPESTGANVVQYTGVVYNVLGSTYDPHIGGLTWKQLLIAYGINNNCYVDPSAAPGTSSHPGFDVGGHMTPNVTGYVPLGGSCLLMPLCAWHNNPARDGQAFSHVQTTMLQLTGYYQGEFAATFMARLPSSEPFSIIYETADGWQTKNLSAEHGALVMAEDWPKDVFGSLPEHYVLLERQRSGMTTNYSLRAKQL